MARGYDGTWRLSADVPHLIRGGSGKAFPNGGAIEPSTVLDLSRKAASERAERVRLDKAAAKQRAKRARKAAAKAERELSEALCIDNFRSIYLS